MNDTNIKLNLNKVKIEKNQLDYNTNIIGVELSRPTSISNALAHEEKLVDTPKCCKNEYNDAPKIATQYINRIKEENLEITSSSSQVGNHLKCCKVENLGEGLQNNILNSISKHENKLLQKNITGPKNISVHQVLENESNTNCESCKFSSIVSEHSQNRNNLKLPVFKCDYCTNIFYNEKCLLEHNITHCKVQISDLYPKIFNKFSSHILAIENVKNGKRKKYTCNVCKRQHISNSSLKEHIHLKHPEWEVAKYKCSGCRKCFNCHKDFVNHKITHRKVGSHKCNYCRNTFSSNESLKLHIISDHNSNKFKCKAEHCGKLFPTKKTLTDHCLAHTAAKFDEDGKRYFQCDFCEKRFYRKLFDLTRHRRRHTGERVHICMKCNDSFTRHCLLQEHISNVHSQSTSSSVHANLECNICGRMFKSQAAHNVHLKMRHGQNKQNLHLCVICGKSCHSLSALNIHISSHTGEKNYICSKCNCGFSNLGTLKSHCNLEICSKFSCDKCQITFTTYESLKKHRQMSHISSKKKQRKVNLRLHKCVHCKRKFTCLKKLSRHKKDYHSHLQNSFFNEENFDSDCSVLSLVKNSTLNSLVNSESSESKSTDCVICKRVFLNVYDLLSHVGVHTGEKQYECFVCGMGFTRETTLSNHLKLNHEVV